jgi:hypothetical protein
MISWAKETTARFHLFTDNNVGMTLTRNRYHKQGFELAAGGERAVL